jgi:hypothetical protein
MSETTKQENVLAQWADSEHEGVNVSNGHFTLRLTIGEAAMLLDGLTSRDGGLPHMLTNCGRFDLSFTGGSPGDGTCVTVGPVWFWLGDHEVILWRRAIDGLLEPEGDPDDDEDNGNE